MYAASAVGSAAGSVYSKRFKLGATSLAAARGGDELDPSRRPSFENAVFGVLFTLSKENSEARIVIRWVILKSLLDGWQVFTTVIQPDQGWNINPDGTAWKIVSILSFNWLADLGYGAYVALLYGMVGLLAVNIGLCVWVAWCFKEQKFPVVWPIKVLRLFSSVFFQAFDIASLNLLQIGISCNYNGSSSSRMYLSLFPNHSCAAMPQVVHAVVSGVSLLIFIALALLTNMAEVEVNPKSRRPMALGHSGAEVMAFGIKVLMTLTSVFLGWKKVAACVYLGLALVMAYQYLRWSPSLVAWVNNLKAGLSVAIVWCIAVEIFLVFRPGIKADNVENFSRWMTIIMLAGIGPTFCLGAVMSWWLLWRGQKAAAKAISTAADKKCPLEDILVDLWADPRDVEIAARCCRVWVDRNILDKAAVARAKTFIKAGQALFPGNAFVSLIQANFMIDVLGVAQSGSRQIEAARKLNPGIMSRFIIFVRMQQAQQKAAGTNAGSAMGNNMDLLGFVEYQRKQRMVVRLHRDALTAMCSFWKALDSHTVSFTYLSKALANIEVSVSRAQAAYHLVLETYGTNFRLVRLYGKFLETVKNDPWGALEYFTEADRLEQEKNDDGAGPLLPDGTPLSRMDELSTAVVVVSASGEIQMSNKQVHHLFGYKKGDMDGKPITMLLAPQSSKRIMKCLASLVERTMEGLGQGPAMQEDHTASTTTAVLAMHHERMAFPLRVSITKASGVGEDSTFIALLEPVHVSKDVSYFWVAANGVITAIDPQFVANFGFMPHDVIGAHLGDFVRVDGDLSALKAKLDAARNNGSFLDRWDVEAASVDMSQPVGESVTILHSIAERTTAGDDAPCHISHRYTSPVACIASARQLDLGDTALYEMRIVRATNDPYFMLVTDKKGGIKFCSPQLTGILCPRGTNAPGGQDTDADAFKDRTDTEHHKGVAHHGLAILSGVGAAHGLISGYSLQDFLPHPWKDTHVKLIKDAGGAATSSRNIWSCVRQAGRGPTMQLRDAHGQKLYMHVSATSAEVVGEQLHIIRLAPSSEEVSVSERRLRLSLNNEGIITAVSKDTPCQQLFGFEATQVIGRPLWELLDGVEQQLLLRPGSSVGRLTGPGKGNAAAFSAILEKAIRAQGRSWRVKLVPPSFGGVGGSAHSQNAELMAAQRAAQIRNAVMHLHIPVLEAAEEEDAPPANPGGGDGSGVIPGSFNDFGGAADANAAAAAAAGSNSQAPEEAPALLVDLWPTSSVTGVLELNALGRITGLLEEHTRPAGLLFGMATKQLVGQSLTALVPLPPGREEVGDLLSASARSKKSSLKTTQKDPTVKVGPVHILSAVHSDGQPLKLAVQVVGKPGPGQPLTVLLRLQSAPLSPGGQDSSNSQLQLPAPPKPIATTVRAPAMTSGGGATSGDDDVTPSIREMEDFVEGRSAVIGRSERDRTGTGMRGSATGMGIFGGAMGRGATPPPTGTGMVPGVQLGRSTTRTETGKERDREKATALEKCSTAKFAAGSGAPGDPLGSPRARPATPSTPVKTPAELLAAHANGSGSDSKGQTPESLTLPPPPPAGEDGAAGGPSMPAAVAAALGQGMDLPLPGVVMAPAQGGPSGGASRRTSIALRDGAALDTGQAKPPPPSGAPQRPNTHRLVLSSPTPASGSPAPPAPKREESSLPGDGDKEDKDGSESEMEGSAGVSKDGSSSKEEASVSSKGAGGGKGGGGSGGGDDDVQLINPKNLARIKEWVESKGEVYQNSKPKGGSGYEDPGTTGDEGDDAPTSDDGGKEKRSIGAGLAGGGTLASRALAGAGAASGKPGARSSRQLWGVASRLGSMTASANGMLPPGGEAAGAAGGTRRTSNTGMALPPGLAPPVQQGLMGDFDDAASNGGQSVMSGQSGGTSSGAEYKRGKRFRSLVKLMDSSEAEQVLRRFRHGALITMAILAVAHTICFAMVVVSIKGQQDAMSQLYTAGRAQRLLNQVLTTTRSLDQVYKGKGLPNLYTTVDIPTFSANIISYASDIKDLNNDVAKKNWGHDSVRHLYYFATVRAWYGIDEASGADVYRNITVWDMVTKIFTSCKDVYQNHANWSTSGVNISSTPSGHFLFKTGPELFNSFRKVLDALLDIAMANTTQVNNLLLAFLVSEGCGVSVLAAAALAYLLRKLAVQRYTLYGTFLAIPVGLTRALTSQLANTTLLEDEDEDDSDDDGREDDDVQTHNNNNNNHNGDGEGGEKAKHRHATLDAGPAAASPAPAPAPSSRPRPSFQDTVLAAAPAITKAFAASDPPSRPGGGAAAMGSPSMIRWRSSSFKGRVIYRLTKCFPCLARRSQTVFPTPSATENVVHGHHRRTLKLDSNDTTRLLMPFVLWSCLVVTFYAVSVAELKQSAPLVAAASVTNFNSARTFRACFYAQELAAEEDPTNIPTRVTLLIKNVKMLRDAFYTLQLGNDAWRTLGNDTERFPLVTRGLSYESSALQHLFYSNTDCLRRSPNLPCPGPEYRYYQLTHAGLDSIMQVYLDHLYAMADQVTDVQPGLNNTHFDFIYNVGTRDLTDANIQVGELHFNHVKDLFANILLLHILLFVLMWFFLAGFYGLLLKPLLARLAREKKHIAELMSQLPMELDVEKLVRAALAGTVHAPPGHGGTDPSPAQQGASANQAGAAGQAGGPQAATDAARAWKNVLRSTIKDANQVRAATRERRASMLSTSGYAQG